MRMLERRNTTKDDILVVCLNITGEVNVSCFRSLIFFAWNINVLQQQRCYTVSLGMFIAVEITFCIMMELYVCRRKS